MAFWLPKEGIQKKFPPEYHESTEADKLPPHRPFDHKVELELGEEPPYFKNSQWENWKLLKSTWMTILPNNFIEARRQPQTRFC